MSCKHTQKGNIIKIISIAAACTLIGASISVLTFAATKNSNDTSETTTSDTESKTETVEKKNSKDETVYVLANADGSVKKIIVSDWIKNNLKDKSLTDKTELKDVKNVKGSESYTMNADNMRVWNADGNDIYAQGTIDKSLPVDLSVSYKLDGKAVSAKELAGKSGKVTIRFDYKNNQYENVSIDGKTEKIYVPFVMLTGMLLDNEKFTDVAVTNGKVINDGSHIAVVGFALPGVQDNLALDKSKLDIPDYVEITANVKKFELATTMTLATNNVFNELDTSKIDSVDGLKDQLGALTSGMSQLLDGSSQLYGGLTTLLGKSNELVSGINQLYNGAEKLTAGTSSLNAGLQELVSNNDTLNAGATKVFETLLGTVQSQIAANGITIEKLTIKDYERILTDLTENPTETQKAELIGIATATANLDEKLTNAGVPEQYLDTVKVMLGDKLAAGKTMEAAIAEISQALQDAKVVNAVRENASIAYDEAFVEKLVNEGVDKQTAALLSKLCNYLAGVNHNTALENFDTAKAMAANAKAVETAMADTDKTSKINKLYLLLASTTLKPTIDEALTQLKSYDEFYKGVIKYTAGAKSAYDGSVQVYDGATELKNGIGQLQSGSTQLIGGVQQLTDGSKKLLDGLRKFNDEGISKITSLVGGDLGNVVTRIKATIDVSKNYQSFAGVADDTDGNVKFIYKTDEIK